MVKPLIPPGWTRNPNLRDPAFKPWIDICARQVLSDALKIYPHDGIGCFVICRAPRYLIEETDPQWTSSSGQVPGTGLGRISSYRIEHHYAHGSTGSTP